MGHSPLTMGTPQIIREPIHDGYLDPSMLRLFQDGTGRLRLTIEGDRSYIDVKATYAFPMTDTQHFIGILDGRDKCIGMLMSLDGLDTESRRLMEEALSDRYFIPEIQCIMAMKEEYGVVYCKMKTDRGERDFIVKGLRDSLETHPSGRLLITDAEGNRYRINDWKQIDARSRRILDNFL